MIQRSKAKRLGYYKFVHCGYNLLLIKLGKGVSVGYYACCAILIRLYLFINNREKYTTKYYTRLYFQFC